MVIQICKRREIQAKNFISGKYAREEELELSENQKDSGALPSPLKKEKKIFTELRESLMVLKTTGHKLTICT